MIGYMRSIVRAKNLKPNLNCWENIKNIQNNHIFYHTSSSHVSPTPLSQVHTVSGLLISQVNICAIFFVLFYQLDIRNIFHLKQNFQHLTTPVPYDMVQLVNHLETFIVNHWEMPKVRKYDSLLPQFTSIHIKESWCRTTSETVSDEMSRRQSADLQMTWRKQNQEKPTRNLLRVTNWKATDNQHSMQIHKIHDEIELRRSTLVRKGWKGWN